MKLVDTLKIELGGQVEEFRLNECEMMALAEAQNAVKGWVANPMDARLNDVGFDQIITTLSAVETRVARQKNLQYSVEDAIDVVTGVGAWKEQGVFFRSFANGGDDLDSWRIDLAQQGATKAQANASVDRQTYPYMFLAKMIAYTRVELEQAATSGIWSAIEEKSFARRREYDLRYAQLVFQGTTDGVFPGLLSLPGVYTEADTIITMKLFKMSDAQFQVALQTLFPASYTNAQLTEKPNRFLIPELDRIGLSTTWSAVGIGFSQSRTRLEQLEIAFRNYTGDGESRVIGNNFANAVLNGGVDIYTMYRKDPFELKVENPVPFGIYPGVSVDGFNFQNTALSQTSGVVAKYLQQHMYIKNSTPDA